MFQSFDASQLSSRASLASPVNQYIHNRLKGQFKRVNSGKYKPKLQGLVSANKMTSVVNADIASCVVFKK